MSSYGWLIEATITSSIAAIIIFIIRLTLKGKLSGKLKYYLWIIFLVRLMVIPLPESNISIYNFIENKTILQQQYTASPMPNTKDEASGTLAPHNKADINPSKADKKNNFKLILLKAYQIITIIFFLISIISYGIFIYKGRKQLIEISSDYLERLKLVKKKLNIKRKITLIYGEAPFIYGIFKVKLVIPQDIPIEEIDAVLVHELIHYKYGDLYINWILILLKAVYWFNPIVWLVFKQIRKDCEVACDERVLEGRYVDKKFYATFLFKNALKGNKYLIGTSSFSIESSNIKERIKMIKRFNKKSRIFVAFGMLVFLLVGAVCLTNGVKDKSTNDKDTNIGIEDNLNNEASSTNNTNININTNSNTSSKDVEIKVRSKVQLYEGVYFDSRRYGGENAPNPYCEIEISNITDTSFDFTVYEVEYTDLPNSANKERRVIFLTNTAVFIEDGTKAVFQGTEDTLYFTFPDNHKAYPIVTDIKVGGFKPLEDNIYLNNGIPGHEFG